MPESDRRRLRRLIRHFFDALFDFGFLSDAGVRSFTGLLLGVCGVFVATGLMFLRVYVTKYANLTGAATAEPFLQAVLADHAFLIGLPMWIVAVVTVLIGHALFPDETDLRVLLPLPVTRTAIFLAKLGAIGCFTGLVIAATQVAMAPLFLLTIIGPWVEFSFATRVLAYSIASVLGSTFAALAVVAVHGALILVVPRSRLTTASAGLRSVMLSALVLSLPFVFRLSGEGRAFATGAARLNGMPPAWFVGIERWLSGDRREALVTLAQLGGVTLLAAAGITAASYAVLYRRFDRAMLQRSEGPGARRSWTTWRLDWRSASPLLRAARGFVMLTLRRSVLHQGIAVALSSLGMGLAVNAFVGVELAEGLRSGAPSAALVSAALRTPFIVMFVTVLATRMALRIPIEPRANWIFRVTEQPGYRVDLLGGATHALGRLGVVAPICVVAPLQWFLFGWGAIGSLGATLLCGWVFVEIALKSWDRIPFTCSYIPGKNLLPRTILVALFSFALFTTFGSALARASATLRPLWLAIDAALAIALLVISRRRHSTWRATPLAFEDALPNEVNCLRLTGD